MINAMNTFIYYMFYSKAKKKKKKKAQKKKKKHNSIANETKTKIIFTSCVKNREIFPTFRYSKYIDM